MDPDVVRVAHPPLAVGGLLRVPTSDTYALSPFRESESSLKVASSFPPPFGVAGPMGATIARDQL